MSTLLYGEHDVVTSTVIAATMQRTFFVPYTELLLNTFMQSTVTGIVRVIIGVLVHLKRKPISPY